MYTEVTRKVRKGKNAVMIPSSGYLITANRNNATVSIINTSTSEVKNTIFVGDDPQEIVLGPDGRFAFVVNKQGKIVLIIDTANFEIMR